MQQMPHRSQNMFISYLSQCWHLHTADSNVRNMEMKRGHLNTVPNLFNSSKSTRSPHMPTRLYDLGGLSNVCITSLNWHELASKTHRLQADKTPRGSVSGVLVASVCKTEKLLLLWRWETEGSYIDVNSRGLTFTNSTFCPHSVFMCFVWIWEQTTIISLYSINWLDFITDI